MWKCIDSWMESLVERSLCGFVPPGAERFVCAGAKTAACDDDKTGETADFLNRRQHSRPCFGSGSNISVSFG